MKPSIATYQVPFELSHLLRLVEDEWPSAVLEVGVYEGGTLWHWLQIADTVVAIDDVCRNGWEWGAWAEAADTELEVLQGYSNDSAIVAAAGRRGPYDMVFIDADHQYESVRRDWLNYSPMVAEGGMLVFHDIIPRPGYGVSEVWAEVKAQPGARWLEIGQRDVEPGNEGTCGIGVAWL